MSGFSLSLFQQPLERVTDLTRFDPLIALKDALIMFPQVHDDTLVSEYFFSSEWKDILRYISEESIFKSLPFQMVVMACYVDGYLFGDEARSAMDKNPQYRIIQKIKSSFWRWGNNCDLKTWNTMVGVYEQLITFSLPSEDFQCAIDWTTGYNARGYSESARIYLDGVFSYLVHYKGEHVMTIGFSFSNDGDLLIQQVQLSHSKGNRFLYTLPGHYIEYIVTSMRNHFDGRKVYVVDGQSLAAVICEGYYSQARRWREEFHYQRRWYHKNLKKKEKKDFLKRLRDIHESYKAYWKKVVEFRSKIWCRLAALYSLPSFTFCGTMEKNKLVFRQIA